MSLPGMALVGIVQGLATGATAEEVVIDFEQVPIRLDPRNDELVSRLERYEEKGVEFKLARVPVRIKARGRIMFFPHVASGRKGILNAIASEQAISVQAGFPRGAWAMTIVCWAWPGTSDRLEAFNRRGVVVARDEVSVVPGRKRPEGPVSTFEPNVKADEISYAEFSGPRTSNAWRPMKFDSLPLTQRRDHIPRRCRSVVASIPFQSVSSKG